MLSFWGCGQAPGAGDIPASSTGLPKEVFIRKADSICEKADQEQVGVRERLLQKAPNVEQSKTGQVRMLDAALPALSKEVARLTDLGVPSDGADQAEAFLRKLRKGLEEAKKDPQAVVGGVWPFTASEKLGKSFGFKACAQPS
jgi:hypothetical protein